MNANFTTAREIGSSIIATFKPKFFVNNTRNKPGYEDEMTLSSKINMWIRSVMRIHPFTQVIYGRKFPAYPAYVYDECFGDYVQLFREFINTPSKNINIGLFRDRYAHWFDEPAEDYITPVRELPEPNPMDAASDELLKNDGVYGYIPESLKAKVKKIISESVSEVLK